ncbi:g-patch domain-containing protein [Colletotrichum chrysophilum]|uniref:PinX1-related protein 1 n=1 Tax=Colletotrichum chrysophilum TaxID=1836956 RepID=A0AAD9ADU7_9PEZI|nr:g-patch domain-containing protein [Colletotrichum chrysophilum]
MGLAQQKSRRKIGKDPNNTKWTKDTESFGQRMLRSQGWEPGQYLGAKDAAHAVHHTAANASFIRVALKDDMLGLGFKQARDDRVTGMDVFSDLLGRLNGKSTEAIDKDRQAREALKSTLYCDTKFGPMRFVSGGFLVGDQVKESVDGEPKEESKDDVKMEDIPAAESSSKKSKKRKAEESSDESESSEDEKTRKKRRKEEKKEKKRKSKAAKEDVSEDTQDDAEKKAKKDKKKEKKEKKKAEKDSSDAESSDEKASKQKSKKDKAEAKETDAEKAARKEEKRKRKEEKRAKKEASRESSSTPATSTPASGTSTPVLRGHHAVRSRWIAQKRMATMDDKALNQVIFMIKSQS